MFKDIYLRTAFIASFLSVFLGLAVIYVGLSDISHLLIIHFDSYRGIDFLGSKGDVLGILIAALAINFVNLFLTEVFYRREKFLSYILAFSSVFLSLLILIAVVVIIKVN
ncbi:MAG: hypothetical protein A2745_03570 [Candidatus Harrisonbacteria bacterium RIFCSPHIGHO2_01_FULL_44_13]|uniref:Uncharacterized protein n=1 Tax=Candidatus Harrisonbacteria bacterium RIFCSPLOWO2_01_FULL_44_18 TaxID=1798407 RepID=A0A1G1ZL38_9BACT|nr:MAG: hypothetical protein A2745_03570 [Candidatus Harrisonbacteria bacterium RIFCSPHIGHO2_01_FULL_44_13]OGY65264.1 MAG: hypothetical protein A3A16_01935 [Candidatus Harrisonbacteria bacterium RIFCSPLOWO2_01_FULL_44_18]